MKHDMKIDIMRSIVQYDLMSVNRVCEFCKSPFVVKHHSRKGRFCSKTCLNGWQRSVSIEDRCGKEQAIRIRESARIRLLKNNPNNDPLILKIKSKKTTEYRKTHPLGGTKNPFFGKKHTDELKERFVMDRKGKRSYNDDQFSNQKANTPRGDRHPMWKGGISFEPYDIRWNSTFKQMVKSRDGNKCMECKSVGRLAVHHIDYNKLNSVSCNCITLCFSCHGKTNIMDRESMTQYFRNKYKNQLSKEIT